MYEKNIYQFTAMSQELERDPATATALCRHPPQRLTTTRSSDKASFIKRIDDIEYVWRWNDEPLR